MSLPPPPTADRKFLKYQKILDAYIEQVFPEKRIYPRSNSVKSAFPLKELNFLIKEIMAMSSSSPMKHITFFGENCLSYNTFKFNTIYIIQSFLIQVKKSVIGGLNTNIGTQLRVLIFILVASFSDSKSTSSEKAKTTKIYSACWDTLSSILYYARKNQNELWVDIAPLVLFLLPKGVIPIVNNPGIFMDLLANLVEKDPVTGFDQLLSVLALNSLMHLMIQHRVDFPNFYSCLFKVMNLLKDMHLFPMLDKPFDFLAFLPNLADPPLHTPKSILFDMLHTSLIRTAPFALSSATLPAAFAKRASQLLLITTTPTAMWLVPFIYELIQTHPGLVPLIHRDDGDANPKTSLEPCGGSASLELRLSFTELETDPLQSKAITSTLWELQLVKAHHINPSVSSFISIFSSDNFRKNPDKNKRFQLPKYTALSYDSMALDYSLASGKMKREPQCALRHSPLLERKSSSNLVDYSTFI